MSLTNWFSKRNHSSRPPLRTRRSASAQRFRPALEALEVRLLPAFTVTTTSDAGPGSLRAAITNANLNPGVDTIQFAIPGGGGHTISPLSALPEITDTVVIDGTTEPGIILNGSNAGLFTVGLVLADGSSGSTIRGLEIAGFGLGGIDVVSSLNLIMGNVVSGNGFDGIFVTGPSFGNTLLGNLIGTNPGGNLPLSNVDGVVVSNSLGNVIQSNVISGNADHGILVTGANATGNVMIANFIGTDATGTKALGNGAHGLEIRDAGGNVAAGNVIASTNGAGVLISFAAYGNVVLGNHIGTDISGTESLGNATGVTIFDRASENLIKANLISGNFGDGVVIDCNGLGNGFNSGNVVSQNLIGLNASLGALPNALRGVEIDNGVSGGAVEHNSIQFNGGRGVWIHDASTTHFLVDANVISNNKGIGVAITNSSSGNFIGGDFAGAANVISFNGNGGVLVDGVFTADDAIEQNAIYGNGGFGGIALTNGGNQFQPAPTLLYAATNGLGATSVVGKIHASPNSVYRIELFDRPPGAPNRVFLGFKPVRTDANGDALFEVDLTSACTLLAATATDINGNTSQFSTAISVSHL